MFDPLIALTNPMYLLVSVAVAFLVGHVLYRIVRAAVRDGIVAARRQERLEGDGSDSGPEPGGD